MIADNGRKQDLLCIYFNPDELRVISSALSRSILTLTETKNPSVHEDIEVYKALKEIIDKKYPQWLITNEEVKKIISK